VVYGDTDSIMIRFEPGVKKAEALARCILKGKEAAGRITRDLFIQPISLLYEKTFHPFLLCSKKRYAGLYFEEADSKPYVAAKGLDLVRRDRIPLARELQKEILDMVLWHKDLHGAVQRIRQVARDLLGGKVALELLVLSKQLKGTQLLQLLLKIWGHLVRIPCLLILCKRGVRTDLG
jgi:DNA polymerase delta subunit 1